MKVNIFKKVILFAFITLLPLTYAQTAQGGAFDNTNYGWLNSTLSDYCTAVGYNNTSSGLLSNALAIITLPLMWELLLWVISILLRGITVQL